MNGDMIKMHQHHKVIEVIVTEMVSMHSIYAYLFMMYYKLRVLEELVIRLFLGS